MRIGRSVDRSLLRGYKLPQLSFSLGGHSVGERGNLMNNIIWIVGVVVIVLFVLGYLGLR
jgi:hypothetical protein